MSKFNTDMICMNCDDAEKRMPEYDAACKAEEEAVRRGDYNFPGIGLPAVTKEPDEADIWKD